MIDFRRAREIVAPDGLPGIARLVLVAENHGAYLRVEAVSAHHQIVRAPTAAGETCVDPFGRLLEQVDRQTKAQLGSRLLGRSDQYLVEFQARDTEIGRIVCAGQAVRGHARHEVAVGGVLNDVLERERLVQVLVEQTQVRHRTHHIAMLDDAYSIHRQVRLNFHQIDRDSHAAQRDGRGQTADPPTDDQYLFDLRHSLGSNPSARGCAMRALPAGRPRWRATDVLTIRISGLNASENSMHRSLRSGARAADTWHRNNPLYRSPIDA